MTDENELLEARLAEEEEYRPNSTARSPAPGEGPEQTVELCQWQVGQGGHTFRGGPRTVLTLPAMAYSVDNDDHGVFLTAQTLLSDDIIELPGTANLRALSNIKTFWESREKYARHGLLYKRGILLWGPPGAGKTVAVHMLAQDIIDRGGIVVFCGVPTYTVWALRTIRQIERTRPLILVMEDVDEIISKYGEHEILAILDGEHQTDNIVCVATTNYPERLGARIINRPSRLDDRMYVDMPTLEARRAYLQKTAFGLSPETVETWAADTERLSIAHLRELVVAVVCLDGDYQTVLRRLKKMNERPRAIDGFVQRPSGFAGWAGDAELAERVPVPAHTGSAHE